jgi:hypothetical protein
VSGELQNETYDLAALTDRSSGHSTDSGVPHGELLIRFADASMSDDPEALRTLCTVRAELTETLGVDAMLVAAAIVGTFNQMVRIADATGIPLDDIVESASASFRSEIGLDQFGSSANTPMADE